ncbi:pathogenicity island protein [Salmonella enterica subsp. enterica]|uniref:Pathogenicity island protein n=1 Tax=Salmonella enterica I TaxID=59201 RepID=A0A447U465_SALET|nr:pathogenicity island protein [Salmonella enterica subsp. enterica]
MERVRLYDEKGNRGRKAGTGLFTAAMMDKYPWLPIEEDGRLHDSGTTRKFHRTYFSRYMN